MPAVSLNYVLRQRSQRKEGRDKVTVAKYKQMSSYVRILTPRPRSERSIVIRKVVDGGGELIVDSLPCILGELPSIRDKISLELVNCGIMAPRWRMRSRRWTPRCLGDTTRQTVMGDSPQSSVDQEGDRGDVSNQGGWR